MEHGQGSPPPSPQPLHTQWLQEPPVVQLDFFVHNAALWGMLPLGLCVLRLRTETNDATTPIPQWLDFSSPSSIPIPDSFDFTLEILKGAEIVEPCSGAQRDLEAPSQSCNNPSGGPSLEVLHPDWVCENIILLEELL